MRTFDRDQISAITTTIGKILNLRVEPMEGGAGRSEFMLLLPWPDKSRADVVATFSMSDDGVARAIDADSDRVNAIAIAAVRARVSVVPDADRCCPGCPGWIVSYADGRARGPRWNVERCDECDTIIDDTDAARLPEAQAALRRTRYGNPGVKQHLCPKCSKRTRACKDGPACRHCDGCGWAGRGAVRS